MKKTNTAAPAATTAGWAWYAVGVLLLAYIFSIMDRQILTLLVGPIQKSLGVNDTLMGLLHGFTFAAFYAVMGLPIARMIDRGNRPATIAVGIAVWSVATAASGLATDFWHLVAARTGVAVGEAVLIPGAVSLLADLFSADKRGRAMGIFGAGAPVGAGVGLLAGGLLLGYFTASPAVLPFVGELLPWQATFVAVGLPGVVIALLMLFVPEPRRIGAARDVPTAGVPVSLTVDFLRTTAGPSPPSCSAPASSTSPSTAGWAGRRPTSCASSAGPIPRSARRSASSWPWPARPAPSAAPGSPTAGGGRAWRTPTCASACSAAPAWPSRAPAWCSAPARRPACVSLALGAVFSFTLVGVGAMSLQETAPAPMRGQVAALFAGVLNIVGAGLGPVAVGLITDYVLRDPSAIGTAIVATCVTASAIGLLLFRSGFATYAATAADAAAWPGANPAPALPAPAAAETFAAAA